MNKVYRNYIVKFNNHPPLLVRASSQERAIIHTIDSINSSLSRLYSGQPTVSVDDFESLTDSPRYNQ